MKGVALRYLTGQRSTPAAQADEEAPWQDK